MQDLFYTPNIEFNMFERKKEDNGIDDAEEYFYSEHEVTVYKVHRTEKGLYKVENKGRECYEIKSGYKLKLDGIEKTRIQKVEIKNHSEVIFSSAFDVDSTVIPGLSRLILDSDGLPNSTIKLMDDGVDEIVINKRLRLRAKTVNYNKMFFYRSEKRKELSAAFGSP